MLNFNLVPENLNRIQRILELFSNELELRETNRLLDFIKIPLNRFKKEGFGYDDIGIALGWAGEEIKDIPVPLNESIRAKLSKLKCYNSSGHLKSESFTELECMGLPLRKDDFLNPYSMLRQEEIDLKNYLWFKQFDLDRVKNEIIEVLSKITQKERLGEVRIQKDLPSKFINSITCVRPKSGDKFLVIINDNYQNTIKGDRAKPSWNLLFGIAEGKEKWYDTGYKNSLDYFNSNKLNRLYTQTGYKITKILKIEGGLIVPNIKLGVISEKVFKIRVRKAEKN